jgi:hypothetical protein
MILDVCVSFILWGGSGRYKELYPVLYLSMTNRIMQAITYVSVSPSSGYRNAPQSEALPGPEEAEIASSPMKKSRSSVPRLDDKWWPEGPAPPVRKLGLLATAGRPEPALPADPCPPFVAIAVGNTNDGESLPAKPVKGRLVQFGAATSERGRARGYLVWRSLCR